MTRARSTWARSAQRGAVIVLTALGMSLLTTAPIHAHEDIAGSDPVSGTVVDEPISEVTIDFGVAVNDDLELALFDPDEQLVEDTTTVKLSDTVARIEFDPLDEPGTYIVRYLTTATVDGHFLVGAVSFTYGSESGSKVPWMMFALAMIVILAIGTALSYRLHRRQTSGGGDRHDGQSEIDEDLSDVGV
jgi:methionine-rich copper-binding protein CopC